VSAGDFGSRHDFKGGRDVRTEFAGELRAELGTDGFVHGSAVHFEIILPNAAALNGTNFVL
jgi:hypothetical protein